MSLLLQTLNLKKSLGGRVVVDDVSLQVESGQVLGLLGPNGAGKTTTMRMIYGFLRPDAGSIIINGVGFDADVAAAKRSMGVCTQSDTFDTDFTVRDNLYVAASYFRPQVPDLNEHIAGLLQRFGLAEFADQKPDTLSGGYCRRLMVARALVNRPKLLFLDEPTTGLDPQARRALWRLIRSLREEGLGIVLTTHYMDEAQFLSDQLVVLDEGKVLAHDTPEQILGEFVGEHVIVLSQPLADSVTEWLRSAEIVGHEGVPGELHVPVGSAQLSGFAASFETLDYDVRKPNLDDLFERLSGGAQ